MAGSDVPAAGPTGREPRQLAAELGSLALDARVAVHRAALIELAGDIPHPERLARWSGTDLVAVYSAPGSLLTVPGPEPTVPRARGAPTPNQAADHTSWGVRRQRWARTLAGWAGALVFLPLLVTWAGLGAAAWAYQEMREAGKGGNESFLGLWQQGFAGELWAPFHFDVMVLYTVLALGGLIAATRLRSRQELADERATRVFAARLAGALAQVQALASGAAHMTPLRFAEELQGAAANLRALGDLAGSVQRETRELVEQARETATLTRSAAEALAAAVAGLQTAAAAVELSADHASQAAAGANRGAEVLSHEVVQVLGEMGRHVKESALTAAGQLSAAAMDAVHRIHDAADDAATHEDNAVRRGVELLDRTAEALGGTLNGARTALENATTELGSATEQLNGTVAALPQALEASAADGAERIGWAYDRAVTALAVSLRGDVRAVSGELSAQLDQLGELARQREGAELSARIARADTEEDLRLAVDEFRRTLAAVAASVTDATERPVRSGPVPGPSDTFLAHSARSPAARATNGLELPYDDSADHPRDEGHTGWDEWYSEDPDGQSVPDDTAVHRAAPVDPRRLDAADATDPHDAVPPTPFGVAGPWEGGARDEAPGPAARRVTDHHDVHRPRTGSATSNGEEGP
ncbi:hypothetical protein ACFQ61_28280 [Streptomyces sp. NPDC056500]|uniref:hypothetical protein n=1 Tax=Streptomyces sp. NPDC056500 TaxID=3345840 RepID=UPI003692AA92